MSRNYTPPKRRAIQPSRKKGKSQKQVFTLRVRDQRADVLLNHLAKQFSLEIVWDKTAIQTARLSAARRVSFSVEKVDLDELLQSILHPAGLGYRREAGKIFVGPIELESQ